MSFRGSMPTFAGGVISRQVRARSDVAKYQTALDDGLNIIGLPSGGQYNRPGFEFGAEVYDSTRKAEAIPFTFATDESYALEFGHLTMRVFYKGGLVLEPLLNFSAATNTSPLTVTVPDAGWAVGDDVYFMGVEGMVEINGLTLRVTSVVGDVYTFGGVDATGWGVFTSSGPGGVDGDDEGGTGGYPPYDPDPVVPPFVDRPEPPQTSGDQVVNT